MLFIAANCPACRKTIQIPDDVDEANCAYCGHRFSARSATQKDAGPEIANLLGMARTATAGGNHAEAMGYYNRVLELDPTQSDAWIGKGHAAGWQSSLANMRLPEMIVAFGHALATAGPERRDAVASECSGHVNGVVVALYGIARKHMLDFVTLPQSWNEYIQRVQIQLDALDAALVWTPDDITTLSNVVHLCKDNIEGVVFNDPFDNNISKAWHLSPEYEAILRQRMNAASSKLKELISDYVPPTAEKPKPSECFVVTATMGNESHPTVAELREFRDSWLVDRAWGRAAARHYYRIGPVLARPIAQSAMMRRISYFTLVAPAAMIARFMMQKARTR